MDLEILEKTRLFTALITTFPKELGSVFQSMKVLCPATTTDKMAFSTMECSRLGEVGVLLDHLASYRKHRNMQALDDFFMSSDLAK